ncbi:unnamed protein product [Cyclocybe aegerita]|uniref:Uncharacterized protein n=1 Tax=Cyclocybe aegerita TaxID=1973307 RepID=A0A8S0VVX6_CYCAE|nr:unnamed protein product [Cyclocybe aegerita]
MTLPELPIQYNNPRGYNPTLKSCALASRESTPISQRQLFSTITLRGPWKNEAHWPLHSGSAENFERLLESSPHLAEYVTCLKILDRPLPGSLPDKREKDHGPCLRTEWFSTDEALRACLLRLKRVQALLINYRDDLHTKYENLPSELKRCLSAVLRLETVVYIHMSCFPLFLLELGPNLKRISFEGPVLLIHPSRVCRPDVSFFIEIITNDKILDFSHLKKLVVDARMDGTREDLEYIETKDSFPWLLSFLCKLATSTHPLTELNLHLYYEFFTLEYIEDEHLDSWKIFAEFLLADHFPNLRKVNVEISSKPSGHTRVAVKVLQQEKGIQELLDKEGMDVTLLELQTDASDAILSDVQNEADNNDNIQESGEDEISSVASGEELAAPPAKKVKAIPEVAVYVDIVTPAHGVKQKESLTTCGPFFFTVETSHNEFLQSVVACAASGTHVPSINAINQLQLFWKLNVPANDKKKPLANVQGYRALILKNIPSTSATSSAHTGEHGDSDEEELQDGSIGSSVREQKAVIGHANTGVIEQLWQLYPVGSNPLYPTKRVYTKDGHSWELNDLCLQVWAMHLMADPPTATLDAPPVSAHFSESQKLRAPATTPASTAAVTSGVPPIGATQPQMPQMPYSYPPYPFYPPYPYSQYPPPQPHGLNPHNHLFHAVRS